MCLVFYQKIKSCIIAYHTIFHYQEDSKQTIGSNEQNPYCIASYNAVYVHEMGNVILFKQENFEISLLSIVFINKTINKQKNKHDIQNNQNSFCYYHLTSL